MSLDLLRELRRLILDLSAGASLKQQMAVERALRRLDRSLAEPLSEDDVAAVLGQAKRQRAAGLVDMPVYFEGLARRMALALGDAGIVRRCGQEAESFF